uniref:Tyrosine-protein kinase ephrin type A/B receptor-like domain-containing protein n=1 Tax=Guillardia theta TaxID=55529 RepID=A0A7S4PK46_GUITH
MDGTFNSGINTVSDINQTILDYRPLPTWKDLSGNGRDAVALTSSNGARYTTQCELLPRVGVRFDGSCGYKTTGTSPFQAKTATIFAVLQKTGADTATQGHVVSGLLQGGTPVQTLGFKSKTEAFYLRDDLTPGTTDTTYNTNPLLDTVVTHDRIVLSSTATYNGVQDVTELRVNGFSNPSVSLGHSAGDTGSTGYAVIGAANDLASAYNFVGFIQEIIVFDIALSAVQAAAIELYLSRKWHVSAHKMDSDGNGVTDYYDPMQALSGCSNCNPGTQVYYGQCSTCPAATYSNDGVMCKTCPSSSTSFAGATSIAQCSCNPGYYRTSLTSCQACPAGFYCPAVCT